MEGNRLGAYRPNFAPVQRTAEVLRDVGVVSVAVAGTVLIEGAVGAWNLYDRVRNVPPRTISLTH